MNIEKSLEEFNSFATSIFNQLKTPSKTLYEAMHYSFFSGGKRIRTQFIYAIGEALNISKSNCHKIAFAIEAIHTYSLIHDDLPAMDNDIIRRGKPTCHIKFNEATAILAGDALQALAFEIIQDVEVTDIDKLKRLNKILAECAGVNGMVGGQQLDIEGENQKLDVAELETIHINKTARMFNASIIMPYIISEYNNPKIESLLNQLSILIGLCFQIKDDILDVTKTTKELGKTSSKDIAANKSTYVSLMGLEDAHLYLNSKNSQILDIINELKKYKIISDKLTNIIDLVINRNY